MNSTMRPRLLALAAAALLAGCGADSSVSPSTPVSLDEVFKELSLPAISSATSAAPGLAVNPLAGGPVIPTGCSYALASQSFVCPSVTQAGFTFSQNYQLLDASGTPLALFDATSLAAVRVRSTTTGTETDAAGSFTIDGQSDGTLSGLQTSRHVLNGTSTMNISGTYTAGTSSLSMTSTMTTTTTDLVIPPSSSTNKYPLSGTIAIDGTSTSFIPGLPSTTHMVLTFDGTSKVKVTINGVALAGCSTIDLSGTTPGCS